MPAAAPAPRHEHERGACREGGRAHALSADAAAAVADAVKSRIERIVNDTVMQGSANCAG